MRLKATLDNVVLEHVPEKENKGIGGLVLPKGAKGTKNQVHAWRVASCGPKVTEICEGDLVLAPDAMRLMHTPGKREAQSLLCPDMIDEHGKAFVVVTEEYCKAVIEGFDV